MKSRLIKFVEDGFKLWYNSVNVNSICGYLKSGKKVYYYQTYKPDGTLSSGKSTGCRTKSAAIHYCETLLMQGRIWSGTNITFSNYAEHFFDYDSIWVQDKLASGTPEHPALSPLYLKKLQSTVRLHLLPYFDKKKFSTIKPTDIKEFRLYLLREKNLSFKSVNDVISVFKTIVDVALTDDLLIASPLRGIKPLMKNASTRQLITAYVRGGFSIETTFFILTPAKQ